MANFSPAWDACARLQNRLSSHFAEDTSATGLEAALDAAIAITSTGAVPSRQELSRAASTARRGERRRASLLARFYNPPQSEDPRAALGALINLARIEELVSAAEWSILVALAEGDTYADVATRLGKSEGALRVQVSRLRGRLLH